MTGDGRRDRSASCERWLPEKLEGEPVSFAYLFGSQATGRARPGSDVDVAVFADETVEPGAYLDLRAGLATRLGSVTGLPRVEVLVLNEAPSRCAEG